MMEVWDGTFEGNVIKIITKHHGRIEIGDVRFWIRTL